MILTSVLSDATAMRSKVADEDNLSFWVSPVYGDIHF